MPGPFARPWQVRLAILAALALHAGLALWSVAGKGVAYDEIFHVTGGYLHDRFGDYRIHPDNGVLPQRLHGLAPLVAGAQPPPMDHVFWRQSDQGVVGHQFFFTANADPRAWLGGARALNLVFSLGVCLLVFGWARSLAGDTAGFVALGLAACSPTLLAHGPLATTDAAAALLLPASVAAFAWHLRERSGRTLALGTLALGAACVTKYSAVILLPLLAALALLHVRRHRTDRGFALRAFAVHVAGAWAIIWLAFGCRFAAGAEGLPPLEHFLRDWEWIFARAGWQGSVIAWAREWRLLPEAFLFGYAHTYVGSLARPAFLAGAYSDTGWLAFFPAAFVWKSSLAELAAALLALATAGLAARRWREAWVRWEPLVLLAGLYGALSLTSHLNIGHRHLLPLYPLLFVAAGAAVSRLPRAAIFGAALVAAQIATAAVAFPHYLAFFNPLAGGPANGWRLLVDSSLDWGQELPALRRWLDIHRAGPDEPVFLSYFGSDSPAFHGIAATHLPFTTSAKFRQRWYEPRAGLYAVSATMLQQVYGPVRGNWSVETEDLFRRLRLLEPEFKRAAAAADGRIDDEELHALWERYDRLRFARLCHYLRARAPDAVVNHAIFLHRLTEDELDRVLRGDARTWAAAVEAAAARNR